MKKILALALAALAAACSSDKKDRTIQYGAAQAPDPTEQGAIANAAVTLQSSLSYQASTEPSAGAVGLGDQLVSELGGYTASATTPDATSAKLARRAVRRAFDTGGMDPSCVVPTAEGTATRYTWTNCQIHVADTDPYSGDTTTMDVTIDGWLKWDPAVRTTTWSIGETLAMTMTSGLDTITMAGRVGLGGSLAVTDAKITAATRSTADVTTGMRGPSGNLTVNEQLETTLTADLDYQADPFCIVGGKLTVAQYATIMGIPQDQGWDFVWTGCGAFTVAHGS